MLKGDQRSPVKVYRLNHPYGFDGKPAVVKEIHPERAQWTQAAMELEVRNLRDVDQLLAALFNGETFFIIMKDLGGERTSVERPRGAEAIQLMKAATELYAKNYGLQREFEKCLKRRPARNDFTWTLEKGSWKVVPVGGWRYAESTGHAEITVPKDRHYCGIKGWQNDLPIFEMLGRAHVSATVHHTGGYTLRAAARVTV
ncbi:hypothetical protein APHAL10511_003557 [Amanita phalloides]|nr:hypothetical protein APHAL10511_003557 [Amanita phalloides]